MLRDSMFLITGLGNPGAKYAHNRHNIGFMFVDEVARFHRFSPWKVKFQGEICEGEIAGNRVYLLKPMTFMNLSGQSVQAASSFYKIPLENCLVAHDELDLPFAKSRMKIGGGHAGHNGLRSISALCGEGYPRLRLGIDHPQDKNLVSHYVLSDFAKTEQADLERFIDAHVREFVHFFDKDKSLYLNKVTLALKD